MTLAIYALVDPLDRRVRYIGRTADPIARFRGHAALQHPATTGCPERLAWIKRLRAKGLKPRLMILEVVKEVDSPEAESRWIRRYRVTGHLFNRMKRSGLPRRARVRLGLTLPSGPFQARLAPKRVLARAARQCSERDATRERPDDAAHAEKKKGR